MMTRRTPNDNEWADDGPDAPVQTDGRLDLPADLELLADRLRRDATAVAEVAPPAVPPAELLEKVGTRTPVVARQWPLLVAGLAAAVCLTVAVRFWPATSEPAAPEPQPAAARQLADTHSPATPDPFAIPPTVDRGVFLSADAAPVDDEALRDSLLQASGELNDQQRIELLERALERYRQALLSQQEKIELLEAELRRYQQPE